jgi:hypothetical protein
VLKEPKDSTQNKQACNGASMPHKVAKPKNATAGKAKEVIVT